MDQHQYIDPILNPGKHSDRLEELESCIAECLKLSTLIGPVENGRASVSFDQYKVSLDEVKHRGSRQPKSSRNLAGLSEGLQQNEIALSRVIQGIMFLKRERFCRRQNSAVYSIVVLDSRRSEVACVVPISEGLLVYILRIIDWVIVLLGGGMPTTPQGKQINSLDLRTLRILEELLGRLTDGMKTLMHYLHLSDHTETSEIGASLHETTIQTVLHQGYVALSHCDTISLVLMMGLTAYAGSHVSPFDRSQLHHCINRFEIESMPNLVLHRRKLACLAEFIGGPVWVFERLSEGSGAQPLALSTDALDLADLWGPIWSVPASTPQYTEQLDTERGVICATHQGTPWLSRCVAGEVQCHWYSWHRKRDPVNVYDSEVHSEPKEVSLLRFESCSQPEEAKYRLVFKNDAKLLIGTPDRRYDFHRNLHCVNGIKRLGQRTHHQMVFLGTGNSYYEPDTIQANAKVGYVLGGGVQMGWKRIPERTHKTMILTDWARKEPQPDLASLSLLVGLRISACTGNAERVSLWDLVKELEITKPGMSAKQCPKFSLPDGYENFARLYAESEDYRLWSRDIVSRRVLELGSTGFDPRNRLQALWLSDSVPYTLPLEKEQCPWIEILRDTTRSSTFAAITDRCLEYHSHPRKGSGLSLKCRNNCGKNQSVLHTRLSLSPAARTMSTIRDVNIRRGYVPSQRISPDWSYKTTPLRDFPMRHDPSFYQSRAAAIKAQGATLGDIENMLDGVHEDTMMTLLDAMPGYVPSSNSVLNEVTAWDDPITGRPKHSAPTSKSVLESQVSQAKCASVEIGSLLELWKGFTLAVKNEQQPQLMKLKHTILNPILGKVREAVRSQDDCSRYDELIDRDQYHGAILDVCIM